MSDLPESVTYRTLHLSCPSIAAPTAAPTAGLLQVQFVHRAGSWFLVSRQVTQWTSDAQSDMRNRPNFWNRRGLGGASRPPPWRTLTIRLRLAPGSLHASHTLRILRATSHNSVSLHTRIRSGKKLVLAPCLRFGPSCVGKGKGWCVGQRHGRAFTHTMSISVQISWGRICFRACYIFVYSVL